MTPMKAAEAVRASLSYHYGEENLSDLMIWDAEKCSEMGYGEGEAAIVWEGSSDPEWAIEVSMMASVLSMPGILAEPYNGHILNFYTVEG